MSSGRVTICGPAHIFAGVVGNGGPGPVVASGALAGAGSNLSLPNWASPGNVGLTNFSYATVSVSGTTSGQLYASAFAGNWSPLIPSTDLIDGIAISFFGQKQVAGASLVDTLVQLYCEGTLIGANQSVGASWGTTGQVYSYGGNGNYLGLSVSTLTAAMLLDASLGFVLAVQNNVGGAQAEVNDCQLTAWHHAPTALGTPCTYALKECYGERLLVRHEMSGTSPSGYVTVSVCDPLAGDPQGLVCGTLNPVLVAPGMAPDMPGGAQSTSYSYRVKDYGENLLITLNAISGTHDVWIEAKQ